MDMYDTPLIAADLATRVERGIALLDQYYPRWRNVIEWDRLEMGSCFWCVLGQVFDDFEAGAQELASHEGITLPYSDEDDTAALTDWASDRGFDKGPGYDYWRLGQEWYRQVNG